jgi:single-strand DNA-binding protein
MSFQGMITGHVGRAPEMKFLDSGTAVCNFSVAVRQPRRQGVEQPARWVRVTAWARSAEFAANYVKQGDGIVCYGSVEAPEVFQKRDGSQGLMEAFTAHLIEPWSKRPEGAEAPPVVRQAPQPLPAPAPAQTQPQQAALGYDDPPF